MCEDCQLLNIIYQFFSAAHRHKIMSLPWSINRLSGEIMEDTGEKRRKYGKYSDFLEDVWYNLWKIIKSYRLDSIDESGMDNQELSIEYSWLGFFLRI